MINESNRGVFCFVCAVASLLFFCPPPAASATHKRTHNFAVSALPCADASGLCSVVVQLPNSSLNPNPPPLVMANAVRALQTNGLVDPIFADKPGHSRTKRPNETDVPRLRPVPVRLPSLQVLRSLARETLARSRGCHRGARGPGCGRRGCAIVQACGIQAAAAASADCSAGSNAACP